MYFEFYFIGDLFEICEGHLSLLADENVSLGNLLSFRYTKHVVRKKLDKPVSIFANTFSPKIFPPYSSYILERLSTTVKYITACGWNVSRARDDVCSAACVQRGNEMCTGSKSVVTLPGKWSFTEKILCTFTTGLIHGYMYCWKQNKMSTREAAHESISAILVCCWHKNVSLPGMRCQTKFSRTAAGTLSW